MNMETSAAPFGTRGAILPTKRLPASRAAHSASRRSALSSAFRAALRAARRAVLTAALACVFMGITSVLAYADGGVSLVGTWPDELDSVNPAPGTAYKMSLQFDKNVGFDNAGTGDDFIQENIQKVHLLDSHGDEVEGYYVYAGSSRDERQVLYVQTTEWLRPLSAYTIRIDEGVQAANGQDVSARAYEITFTTSAECSNGLTVYQNALIPLSIAMVAGGIAVAAVRLRKERR